MASTGDGGIAAVGRQVLPPRSKGASGYSAGEMRQVVQVLDAWRSEHPDSGDPGPEDGWHGNVRGVEAFVAQDTELRVRLARNHPWRLRLLRRVDRLPFLLHHEVISLALSRPAVLLVATSAGFDVDSTDESERSAILRDLETVLQAFKVLALLHRSAGYRFPGSVLKLLLWVLVISRAVFVHKLPANQTRSPDGERPPGQLLLTEPRVARAPGMPCPSLLITVGAAAGRARLKGTL